LRRRGKILLPAALFSVRVIKLAEISNGSFHFKAAPGIRFSCRKTERKEVKIMQKINFFLAFCCLVSLGFLSAGDAVAQKRKSDTKKKKTEKIYIKTDKDAMISLGKGTGVSGGGSLVPMETSMILEPCAKETAAQISELEDAPDTNKQLEILIKRIDDKDDWLRACAVYRLGEFGAAAAEALPVILKLLRDEKNEDVWVHIQQALWKVPPDRNLPLRQRLELAKNADVYLRIYGVYALSYAKVPPATFEAKDIVSALIEAAADEDVTVTWLAVMGIRQQGFYGVDTSPAIPVLSELLQKGKINPLHPVRAFVPMGANALPAAPVLFDVLYNPKKYVGEKDRNNRAYSLYLTTAIALGKIGKPLVPMLEKEFEKQPFSVLQVLKYLIADGTLPIFIKAMQHQNPQVRKRAIENLPTLTSIGAIEMVPPIIAAAKDADLEVREAALSALGSIALFTPEKSDALKEMLKKQAIPVLIANLENKETVCFAALNLPGFGADAEIAIPALRRLIKKENGNYCAESALFRFGEKGRKFLTKEQIERLKETNKTTNEPFDTKFNKAKPIKPKTEPKPVTEKTKDT
jgi:HEAT repeat protein